MRLSKNLTFTPLSVKQMSSSTLLILLLIGLMAGVLSGFVGIGGVEPTAVVADDDAAGAIVVEALQIETGAVILGFVDVGIQAEVIGQRPVDGRTVLQLFADLARRLPENHPRMHQVVDRCAGRGAATGLRCRRLRCRRISRPSNRRRR